jgi:UPF0042 nucleotide-binding protein
MSSRQSTGSSRPSTVGAAPPAPLPATPLASARPRTGLTLLSFGFKYGRPPANHVFDVSFLKNPAREASWGLWSAPSDEMRHWVLAQPAAIELIEAALPYVRFLARTDDDVRIAFGCSAGRHRSTILVEELARRLRDDGLDVTVFHREREFA